MFRLISALLLLAAMSVSAFAQSIPAGSSWKNQRGSQMYVANTDINGNFSGTYINNAAGFQCQGTPYQLAGRAGGSHLTFVVVWKNFAADCHSKTVWRGRLIGTTTIQTHWVLTGPGIPTLRGADTFQRQP